MNIWEINSAIAASEILDPETGEFITLDAAALDALAMERDEKLDNLCCWMKNEAASAAAIGEQIKALQARKKAAESKAERLKEYIQLVLDGQKFKTARNAVSYRKSTATEVLDLAAVPDEFCEVERKPVKAAIKAALTAGQLVPGAQLVERQSIIIK